VQKWGFSRSQAGRHVRLGGNGMRKTIWILALAAAALCVPAARADSFDASFTCTTSCVDVPTDPVVTFPSPTIPIFFFGQTFTITLNALDTPHDSFQWSVVQSGSFWYLLITDLTNGSSNYGQSFSIGGSNSAPFGSGGMWFTDNVAAPEPSAGFLLVLGVGAVLLLWKLRGRGAFARC